METLARLGMMSLKLRFFIGPGDRVYIGLERDTVVILLCGGDKGSLGWGHRNVALAQGGMKALSDATQLNRENLYDMLSKEGNPRLSSLTTILSQLGMEVSFKPKMRGTEAA